MFGNLRSLADNAKHISKNTFRELKEALRDEESDECRGPHESPQSSFKIFSPRSVPSAGSGKCEDVGFESETPENPSRRVSTSLDNDVCPAQTQEEFWQQPLVAALLPAIKRDIISDVPDSKEWRALLWAALTSFSMERDALHKDRSELVALVKKNKNRTGEYKTAVRKAVEEVDQLRGAKSILEDELQRLREKTKQPSSDETIAPLQQAVEDMQSAHDQEIRRLRAELAKTKADLSAEVVSRATVVDVPVLDADLQCNALREQLQSVEDDMRFLVKEREKHFIEAENFVDRRLIAQMLDRIKGSDSQALHDAILSQAISIVGTSSDQRPRLSRELSESIGDKLLQFVDDEIQHEK